jgi:hypothetical protein
VRCALSSSAAAALLAAIVSAAHAEPDMPYRQRTVRAARAEGPISIDGVLDEPAWRAAEIGTGFLQTEPDDGDPATADTRFRVLWDDDSLYVGIECDDPQPPTATRSRRDRDIDADLVRVDLDTTLDRRTAYHFGVYAGGQQVDGIHFNDIDYTSEWDAPWESAVATRPHGWSVEMRIPLRVLRIPDGAAAFGLQVARTLTRRHEEMYWQYSSRGTPGVVSRFGLLVGLDGIHPVRQLELKPYVAVRGDCGTVAPDAAVAGVSRCSPGGTAGLDLRYGLTSGLTLVGAANPDFGQVEVDERVLNLTTFETFFPEKRPFFLAGMDLFNLPLSSTYLIFHSRRIGGTPSEPPLGANEELVSTPASRSIAGAAKITGSAGAASVAALTALEPRTYARVLDANGRLGDRRSDDAVQSTAVRARAPLGPYAVAGITATARNPLAASAGRNSLVGASDVALFDAARDWNGALQFAGSALVGGPQQVERDGTVIGNGRPGWAGSGLLAKDGGALTGSLSFDVLTPTFWVNELGFMERQNLLRARASLRLKDLHSRPAWRRASIGITAEEQRDFDGFVLKRRAALDGSLQLHSYWNLSLSAGVLFPFVDDRELGDGTPLERRGLLDVKGEVTSDTRRAVFADLFAELQEGEQFLVRKLTLGTTLTLRPHPAFDAVLGLTYENDAGEIRRTCGASVPASGCFLASSDPAAHIPPESAARADRLYLLADQRAESLSAIARTTLAITPRLSLQLFAQLFTEGIAYGTPLRIEVPPGKRVVRLDALRRAVAGDHPPVLDDRQASLTLDFVLRWEWRVGSTMYLVYQHRTSGDIPSPERGVLSFPGEVAALGGPGAVRGDTMLVKIDLLSAL